MSVSKLAPKELHVRYVQTLLHVRKVVSVLWLPARYLSLQILGTRQVRWCAGLFLCYCCQ